MLFNAPDTAAYASRRPLERPSGNGLELCERDDQHPVRNRPPNRRRICLRELAETRAVRQARDAKRDRRAGRVGHVRLLVVHAGDGARLGAIRSVVGGRRIERRKRDSVEGLDPVQHHADRQIARRPVRRALVVEAEPGDRRRSFRGSGDRRRRILCNRTRGADADRRFLPAASCSSGSARRSTSTRGTRPSSSRRFRKPCDVNRGTRRARRNSFLVLRVLRARRLIVQRLRKRKSVEHVGEAGGEPDRRIDRREAEQQAAVEPDRSGRIAAAN